MSDMTNAMAKTSIIAPVSKRASTPIVPVAPVVASVTATAPLSAAAPSTVSAPVEESEEKELTYEEAVTRRELAALEAERLVCSLENKASLAVLPLNNTSSNTNFCFFPICRMRA